MSDGGGAGGGKGWSNGVPYGRCMLAGGWSGGAVGMEDEIGGIINAEEAGKGEKNEGLTRFVTRALLPLLDSWASRRGISGVDEVGTVGVDWIVGNGDGVTLGVWESKWTGAEGCCGCVAIAAFDAFPIFTAACKT